MVAHTATHVLCQHVPARVSAACLSARLRGRVYTLAAFTAWQLTLLRTAGCNCPYLDCLYALQLLLLNIVCAPRPYTTPTPQNP